MPKKVGFLKPKKFSGINFKSKSYDSNSRDDAKLRYEMSRYENYESMQSTDWTLGEFLKIVESLDDQKSAILFSYNLNMPNILKHYAPKCAEIFIGTFAISAPALVGIQSAYDNGCEIHVLVDYTFYRSRNNVNAYKRYLQGKVDLRKCKNHSKYLAMKFKNGTFLNVYGSANLSKNPSFEMVHIGKSKEEFEFMKEVTLSMEEENG